MLDPYATKVLNREHHDRFVADIDNFALDAGIQKHWFWTPLDSTCGPEEIEYVRKFNATRAAGLVHGLCYVPLDKFTCDAETRMYALAGALVRNFVRARVITVNSVIDQSQHGRAPEATCLLIPNFFLGKADGGGLPAWQVAILYDVLLARSAQGLQTVVYVSSLDLMKKEYGFNFTRLIQTNYKTLEV